MEEMQSNASIKLIRVTAEFSQAAIDFSQALTVQIVLLSPSKVNFSGKYEGKEKLIHFTQFYLRTALNSLVCCFQAKFLSQAMAIQIRSKACIHSYRV